MRKPVFFHLVSAVIVCFLLPGLLQAQQLAKEAFELLNLDAPGLAEVKKAYVQNDMEAASEALLDYYRKRTTVKHPDLDLKNVTVSGGDQQKADEALSHILYAHEGYQPSFYYGKDIDWKYWPIKDNELRWQLHRQKWFIPMGKMYYTTRDEKYAKEWAFQYVDWIKKNPLVAVTKEEFELASTGEVRADTENARFAWRPLEVGTRLEDQTQQFMLFKDASAFTPEFLTVFLVNYHQHANHILHNYSKAGNHLLFEAQQILYAGTFFPEYKDAATWRKSGIEILVREAKKQVYDDGGQFELDPLYHMAAIEIFCRALLMADVNGSRNEFPQEFLDTIEKMVVFYYNICFPDYTNPSFSDAKRRGKAPKLVNYRIWTKLFPQNEQIRYFATEGKEGKVPENLSKGFATSGFFTFRNGWKDDATVMVLKAGPEGGWHNQPDNGTFELWVNGTNLFPDSGFYIYAGDANVMKLRNWFRQTMVHKTLTLDNKNLETHSSVTRLWKPEGKTPTLVTENQSYANLKHRRSVFFVDQKYFVIVDEAVGTAKGKIGLHYQMNAGKVNIDPQEFILTSDYGGKSNAKLQCFAPQTTTLEEEEGWQSTLYLVREKRTAVSFNVAKKDDVPVRYITVIYPTEDCSKAPTMSARFIKPQYDEKSLKIEVVLDGQKKVLDYKL
ncbi:heparin-sulfate lyase HepC [Bacteroides reticulotermitis]|uniref:heparin-sulfate lyase HepC n=1 Tax=Bacteroides reticulotermitis TaxID=1133319 RepID=UPI003A8C1047